MSFLLYLFGFSCFFRDVSTLPLHEYAVSSHGDDFVIILSGDGGWHSKDADMAHYFQQHQIPTVGWDSRSYFWQAKEKNTFRSDLEKVIDLYSKQWEKSRVILIGFSFGADVLPYTVNRLATDYQDKIKHLVLISPGHYTQFEITLTGLLNIDNQGIPTLPELKAIHRIPVLLVCDSAQDSICKTLDTPNYTSIILPGGHTFRGKLLEVAKAIGNYLHIN